VSHQFCANPHVLKPPGFIRIIGLVVHFLSVILKIFGVKVGVGQAGKLIELDRQPNQSSVEALKTK